MAWLWLPYRWLPRGNGAAPVARRPISSDARRRLPVPKLCEHNIPETLKGAGPCEIKWEVHKRNGKPKYWCHTHGLDASAPDGAPLEACAGSWFDAVPSERQLTVEISDGELAIWGGLRPTLTFGDVPGDAGKVHVHHRPSADGKKDVDGSYDIVHVRHDGNEAVIEGMAALARSVSELADQTVVKLQCPQCGGEHIDELRFATYPHRKHQCNFCGRDFWDSQPSISNPLAGIYDALGLKPPKDSRRPDRPLVLNSADYAAIAIWPSNSAILSTMSRPEEVGIHVHAWDETGKQVIDETYSPVVVDGLEIDERALRRLAVQQALAHGAPISRLECGACGASITSPESGWVEPSTTHECGACGALTKTRRRSFLNPLAPV
jgi:predicted RNA-binding Zn-ribbon protein involved in translation (DUF1610 family)